MWNWEGSPSDEVPQGGYIDISNGDASKQKFGTSGSRTDSGLLSSVLPWDLAQHSDQDHASHDAGPLKEVKYGPTELDAVIDTSFGAQQPRIHRESQVRSSHALEEPFLYQDPMSKSQLPNHAVNRPENWLETEYATQQQPNSDHIAQSHVATGESNVVHLSPPVMVDSVAIASTNQVAGQSSKERFPGNVRGILRTGYVGFGRMSDHLNKIESRNTPHWQNYLNRAYFDNRLVWMDTPKSEIKRSRKATTQFVLPAISQGMPNVRIHRHMPSRRRHDSRRLESMEGDNIQISLWSDPDPKDDSTKWQDQSVKKSYTTYFYGVAQLRQGSDEAHVVRHLEQLLQSLPRATVFTLRHAK